jgi:NTE family protein
VLDLPDPSCQGITITGIRIEGLHEVSEEFVLHQLALDLPRRMSCQEIEKAVNRLYGSRYFQSVTYRFQAGPDGEILIVKVREDANNFFRAGIHYDTELNAMLLMELSFRNLLSRGSEVRVDAALSQVVALDASYFFQPGWQRGLGFGADFGYQGGGMAIYNVDKVKAYVDQHYWKADCVAQGTLFESLAFGLGLEKEIEVADSTLTTQNDETSYVESLNGLAYLRADSLDRNFYPRQGWKVDVTGKYVTDRLTMKVQEPFRPYYRLLLNATRVLPLFPHLSLAGTLRGGATLGDTVNPTQWFYVGGMTSFERNKLPFVGMPNIEAAGPNVLIADVSLQFEPWEDRFIVLRANVGRTGSHVEELFQQGNLLIGYGVSLGALTVIGPVEGTLMADKKGIPAGFINIGYPV